MKLNKDYIKPISLEKLYEKQLANNPYINQVRDTYQQVSEYDLLKTSPELLKQGNESALRLALHLLGLDVTSEEFECLECFHRPKLSKDIFYGLYWVAPERIDIEWLTSGYASVENLLEVRGDLSLNRDLYRLQNTGSSLFISETH